MDRPEPLERAAAVYTVHFQSHSNSYRIEMFIDCTLIFFFFFNEILVLQSIVVLIVCKVQHIMAPFITAKSETVSWCAHYLEWISSVQFTFAVQT